MKNLSIYFFITSLNLSIFVIVHIPKEKTGPMKIYIIKFTPYGQDSAKFFSSHATFEGLLDVRTPPTMPQVGLTWICFCWEVGSTNPLNRPNFHNEVVWFFQSHTWVFESRVQKTLLNLYKVDVISFLGHTWILRDTKTSLL